MLGKCPLLLLFFFLEDFLDRLFLLSLLESLARELQEGDNERDLDNAGMIFQDLRPLEGESVVVAAAADDLLPLSF